VGILSKDLIKSIHEERQIAKSDLLELHSCRPVQGDGDLPLLFTPIESGML
jgi:hypothetical protein